MALVFFRHGATALLALCVAGLPLARVAGAVALSLSSVGIVLGALLFYAGNI